MPRDMGGCILTSSEVRLDRETKRRLEFRVSERRLCGIILFGVAITLIPVLWIGLYNVPCADDYSFGVSGYHVWQETKSLWGVLCAAARNVKKWYLGWQGTFSAVFFMSLQPAIFGDGLYRIVPLLTVGGLAAAELFFTWALLRRTFGATRSQFLMVAAVWLALSVQLAPSAVEAFYWYNGAVYYTGYFSISLFYFGMLLQCIQMKSNLRRWVWTGLLCAGGIVLGGGNYVTALVSLLVTGIAAAVLIVKRHKCWKNLLLPLVFLAGAFALSVAAPGNAIRQAGLESVEAGEAIKRSLIAAVNYIGDGLDMAHMLAMVFVGVILWRVTEHTTFHFPLPLLVGAVSYGVYAAQFCPTIYAMNSFGPGRLQNIIYDMFLLLLIFNLFYVLGWIRHHYNINPKEARRSAAKAYPAALLALLGAALLLCFAYVPRETPITGTRAFQALRSGAAKQYYSEYQARQDSLMDETQKNVVLQAYTQRPYVLFFSDATEDPEDWKNVAMADYFGKERVTVRSVE